MQPSFSPYTPLTRQSAMDFLRAHLPESDLVCYEEELFYRFIDHALLLRQNAPWCAELDEELFLHYVLFPRVNDEDLSFHREIFRTALWDRIKNLPSTAEMVLEVNRWCHEIASYEMQDDRTASPLTVYRCGSGRCGEESAFLVSALRSIGIPARQVYAPRWAHCDDNHAWVEALCGGQWRFLGACEPEPILDRGWFNSPASRALLVHSRVFGESRHPLHGEQIGTEHGVTWYNQTPRYALTHRQTLRATIGGNPAAGAVFRIQVLNESSFHTIATLTANANGEAFVELGIGDIHILAVLGDRRAECDCRTGDAVTLALEIVRNEDTDWQEFDFLAPTDAPVNPALLNAEQKRDRAAVLADGRAKREARIAAMLPAGEETAPYADLLRAARGNAPELIRFLRRSSDSKREAMLRSLTDKDLRDAAAELLENHLTHAPAQAELPDELYIPYVLCPRVELEPLSSVGSAAALFRDDPLALWKELLRRITITEPCHTLVWQASSALQAGRCDRRSLFVLYVSLLRALGVPARLRRLDGCPEYWQDGFWHCVDSENCGTLVLRGGDKSVYRQNWTLSRREADGWKLMHLEDQIWEDGQMTLRLPEGQYRLIASIRMPNGNQFAARRELTLHPGATQSAALFFRSYALSDLLRRQRLPVMSAVDLDGEAIDDICRLNDRPTLLFWLEAGGEPTEHILNELLAVKDTLSALPVNLVFLPRSRESLRQQTLARTLEHFPRARVLLSDWAYDLETTARHLTCDPDTPPLVVACDRSGSAVFGISGYSIGAVELVTRIAGHLAGNAD